MFSTQDHSSDLSPAGEVTRLAEHREAVRNSRRRFVSTLGVAGAVAGTGRVHRVQQRRLGHAPLDHSVRFRCP